MFLFIVRYLRWLAKVPLFPQIFDGLLLAGTWIFYPSRVKAMEMLEAEILKVPKTSLRVHRFGGMEFFHSDLGEIGHVHGHGLLDLQMEKKEAGELIREGKVRAHHVLPRSGWVSFQLRSEEDVPFAIELLGRARAMK